MSNKPRNKEKTTQKIAETFFTQVLEKGYSKVNINHVAKAAKVSIGTLYHHFPQGKIDIILKFFEESKDLAMDVADLKKFDPNNIPSAFEKFIASDLNNQREKRGYRVALRQAILADQGVCKAFQGKIQKICTELVQDLRASTPFFQEIPEEKLIQRFSLIYNLIESIVHHHLFIMNLFPTDDELKQYLLKIIELTISYTINSTPTFQ